jgi:hypothetical protein
MWDYKGKNQSDYCWFDNKAEILPQINALLLMKLFSNQPGLVPVNRSISFAFNFVYSLTTNDIGSLLFKN